MTKDFQIITSKEGDKWLHATQIIEVGFTGQQNSGFKEEPLRLNLSNGILNYSYNLNQQTIFIQCQQVGFKIHGNGELLDKELFY